MKSILPIILVAAAVVLGYYGFTQLDASTTNIEIGPIDIEAGNEEGKSKAYVFLGLAVIALLGAVVTGRGQK